MNVVLACLLLIGKQPSSLRVWASWSVMSGQPYLVHCIITNISMSSARRSISLIVIDVLDVHKLETAEEKLYWWIYWLFAHLFHFLSITKANASSFLDRSLS